MKNTLNLKEIVFRGMEENETVQISLEELEQLTEEVGNANHI